MNESVWPALIAGAGPGMPGRLVLVRHGESEGNKAAVDSPMPDEFWLRHTSRHALTERGVEQAVQCGNLLRELGLDKYDRYLVSPMRRTLATAGHLGLPDARWQIAPWLSERAWGPGLRTLDVSRRIAFMADARRYSAEDPWFWAPPGGETIAGAATRALLGLIAWAGPVNRMSAIAVAHGELIRGVRSLLLPGLPVDAAENALGNAEFVAIEWDDDGNRRVLTPRTRRWSDFLPAVFDNADLIQIASEQYPETTE